MNEAEVYKWMYLTRSKLWTVQKLISVKFWLNSKCSKLWLKLPSPNEEQCGWRWVTPFSLTHSHPVQLFYTSFSIMQLTRTWSRGKGTKGEWPRCCSNSTREPSGPFRLRSQLWKEMEWIFTETKGNPLSISAAREESDVQDAHFCQHEFLSCPPTRYIFSLEKWISISSIAWLLHTDQSTFLSFPNKLGSSSRGKYFPLAPFPACSLWPLSGPANPASGATSAWER